MKAVRFDRYGGIEVLQVANVPVPEPSRGEALVKVKAASINPGAAVIGITIIDFAAAHEYGAKAEGGSAVLNASMLAELAALIASGNLEVPIAATFPLDQVRAAFSLLAQGHIRGKIVLLP